MKRLLMILLLALLLLPGSALAQTQALVIAAGEHITGSVATVAQDIRVEGSVDGDVTSWSGTIVIAGSVSGDVVSYSGAVTVLASGRVGGHVLASSGPLQLDSGAAVAGQLINRGGGGALSSLIDLLTPSPTDGDAEAAGRVLFGVVLGVLLVAFSLLYSAFWPGRIAIASVTLRRMRGRALLLGLLTTLIIIVVGLPLSGLLVASVLGVPALLVLAILTLAIYVYGIAVLARTLGARRTSQPAIAPGMVAVMLGLALLVVLVMQVSPLWALALFYVLASPGLGAAILSRGGMALPLTVRL